MHYKESSQESFLEYL